MIEVFASRPNYLDHLAPIITGLGDDGRLLAIGDAAGRARQLGLPFEERVPRRPGPPVLVAGSKDADWTHSSRRLALLEHGTAQTYTDVWHKGYAGGPDWQQLSLVLVPGPHAALQWSRYPGLRVEQVGVPKLDPWINQPMKPRGARPVVAFTFHWRCRQSVETWPAFDDYTQAIRALPRDRWDLLGHWHPRWGTELVRWYRAQNIERAPNFDEVLDRADLLVVDNSSVGYEFAATGRPVLLLEEHRWRHDVEHGLRFWSYPPGITCPEPGLLATYIDGALDDGPTAKTLRAAALARAYGDTLDGKSTHRAMEALQAWV